MPSRVPPPQTAAEQTRSTPSESAGFHAREAKQRATAVKSVMNLNLVAMIDVVFLLLMYFLLATNFSIGEEMFSITMPAPLGQAPNPDPFDLPDQPVVIRVESLEPDRAQYQIYVDLAETQPASFDQLFRLLRQWRVSPENSEGIIFPDTPILIQPGTNCRWDHAINALNACLRAQYTKVQFMEPETGNENAP